MERIDSIDNIRAICAMFIIGIWHLDGYFFYNHPIYIYLLPITKICLASFTFISGYLNGRSQKGVWPFYLSRMKRLLFPFLMSYVLLVLIGFNTFSIKGVVYAMTGLCMFRSPCPLTLWYVSMLFLLYFGTPILKLGIPQSILVFSLILLGFILGNHDPRIVILSLFYIVGVTFSPIVCGGGGGKSRTGYCACY